jgi:hypothetical protein
LFGQLLSDDVVERCLFGDHVVLDVVDEMGEVVPHVGDLVDNGVLDGDFVHSRVDAIGFLLLDEVVPWVLGYLDDGSPFIWGHYEDFGDEVFGGFRDLEWEFVGACHDLLVEFLGVGVAEGEVPGNHHKKHDSRAPDIDWLGVIAVLAREHFRGRVAGRPALGC